MSREVYECNDQMVSHPSHYQSGNGMEVIDVIEAFTADLTGIEAYNTGNAIKYICRWKKKNGIQDLKKAMWYLQDLINHLDTENKDDKPINIVPEDKGRPVDKSHTPEFVFGSIFEAREFEKDFIDLFRRYGMARVSDVLDLVGMGHRPSDNDYGWVVSPDILVTENPVNHDVTVKFSPEARPLTIKPINIEKENN